MRHKIIAFFLLIFVSTAFELTQEKKVGGALWNIGSEHRGFYLLIHGKKYGIPSALAYRRMCYDGATTIVDDDVIDDIPDGDYKVGISDNAQLAATFEEGSPWYLLTSGEKWPISNGENFDKYGFDRLKVAKCQPSYLDLFKTGWII